MAKIELKQPIVEEIASTVKDAATVVIVSYSGITVAQDTQLRRQLREAGVTYKVYKNTLMTRAFKGTEFEGLTESLKGTNAIAVCMAEIAKIPSRDELISKFLGSIQSPITNFARVLNQIAEKGGADACEPAPKETAEDGETVTAETAAEAPAAE